uniref:Transmembrane protein n=1 Tax=Ralstonia solanacearum TaxID=305 RepID=A0A0S4TV68_RALSL|nr:protein of unknown function [Ralstonia solanacearum]
MVPSAPQWVPLQAAATATLAGVACVVEALLLVSEPPPPPPPQPVRAAAATTAIMVAVQIVCLVPVTFCGCATHVIFLLPNITASRKPNLRAAGP